MLSGETRRDDKRRNAQVGYAELRLQVHRRIGGEPKGMKETCEAAGE